MAVAECPNCQHDIQTPKGWWYSDKGWDDFSCPYCRAELRRKHYWFNDVVRVLLAGFALAAAPHNYLRLAEFVVPAITILTVLFTLSRPKLMVTKAPYAEERDLKRRLELRQSSSQPTVPDAFAKKKEDAITDFRINPRRSL
jgi:hypothetical protein